MYLIGLQFFFFFLLIIIAGWRLSDYANRISKKSLFPEGLFGVVFLAIITSLPEIFTSIGSVTVVHFPDMAASDAIGSIFINLMIIIVLDIIQGKGGILSIASKKHILTASLTILVLGIVSISLLLRKIANINLGFFNIGLDSILIIAIYIFCLKLLVKHGAEEITKEGNDSKGISSLWFKFIIAAILVVISGFKLAELGGEIVTQTNLSDSFVGLVFLAVATSLPELIVSWSAVKHGSIDMAIGNVLGSNFFDTAIIPITDIFYRSNQIMSDLNISHIFTITLCMILTAIIISGLIYRSKKSILKVGWDVFFMVIIVIISIAFFYMTNFN
jgi:cation:H+ antiporter